MYQRLREIVHSEEAFSKFQERLPENHYGTIGADGNEDEGGCPIEITVDIFEKFNEEFDKFKKVEQNCYDDAIPKMTYLKVILDIEDSDSPIVGFTRYIEDMINEEDWKKYIQDYTYYTYRPFIYREALPSGISDENLPENWVKCYYFTNRQDYVDGLLQNHTFPVWNGIPPQDCLDDLDLLFQSCGEYFFDSCLEAKSAV